MEKYIRNQLECDFVVNKGSLKYYIQSAYYMIDEEKVKQEKRSFLNSNDSFKKIIVVRENIKANVYEYGILTISLKDFLLNDDIFKYTIFINYVII